MSDYGDFCREMREARRQYRNEHMTEKSNMLYSEWKGLMHLSVEDNGKGSDIAKRRLDLSEIFACDISDTEKEYKALFALQTTYAIIVKLIACKVVDRLNFNEDAHDYHDLSILPSDKMLSFACSKVSA